MKQLLAFLPFVLLTACKDDNPKPNPPTISQQDHNYTLAYRTQAAGGQTAQLTSPTVEVYAAEPTLTNGTYTLGAYTLRHTLTDAGSTGRVLTLTPIKTITSAPDAKLRIVLTTANRPATDQSLEASLYDASGGQTVLTVVHTSTSAQLSNGKYTTTAEYTVLHTQ